MAYVDLNPIRATMAKTLEQSDHTCVKARIDALSANKPARSTIEEFVGSKPDLVGLPFRLIDYLELVDWSGRIIHEDKRGSISQDLPPILDRLSLDKDAWYILTTEFEHQFRQWVGTEQIVRKIYADKHYQRISATEKHRSLLG